MTGLILFSHGSVLCGAGCSLAAHAREIELCGEFPIVEVGYLNYSRPAFADAVQRCIERGARRIIVVPYFLAPGKFVSVDLPGAVERETARWPQADFVVAEPLGFDERIADAVLDLAASASGPERWRDDLERAPEYCEGDPACPLFGDRDCPLGRMVAGALA